MKKKELKKNNPKSKSKETYQDRCISTGLLLGVLFGIILSFMYDNFAIFPLSMILGFLIGATVGNIKPKKKKN